MIDQKSFGVRIREGIDLRNECSYCGYSHIPEVTVFPADCFKVGAFGKLVKMMPLPDSKCAFSHGMDFLTLTTLDGMQLVMTAKNLDFHEDQIASM